MMYNFDAFLSDRNFFLGCVCYSVVGSARILPPYSLWIVKHNKKGQRYGSRKPLLSIFSLRRQGTEGEGRAICL